VPEIAGVSQAYIGLLPASQFISILRDEDGEITKSIFYDNVRDWQDYNPVNSEIRATLGSPAKAGFALMNNGITIIAKSLQTTGDKFNMEDFQIVNGCQTSHVLFDQREQLDDSVKIPLRLICTQDEALIKDIIRATNRQTEVKVEQFLAADDFQKKLEEYFKSFPNGKRLYYERRSRQYADQNIEQTRIVTVPNLVKAYAAMFLELPHRTVRGYATLRESVGKDSFVPGQRLEPYYLSAFAAYRLEFYFRNLRLDPKYKLARYQLLLALRLAATPERPPRPNENAMEKYCEPILEQLWDLDKSDGLLAKATDVIAKVSGGQFERDVLHSEPFTKNVRAGFGLKA
jgi:AIPR protein